jgi:mono/diheme cytochrome c family protein
MNHSELETSHPESNPLRSRAGRVVATVAALLALLVVACGSARRAPPLVGPQAVTDEQREGRRVFLDRCDSCHPGGEAGLGPALNNKPLPKAAIKMQVRQGLGAMPDFSDRELADPELERLVEYVVALREKK